MRDYIVYAVIMIGCLVYPWIVNVQFSYKYSCNALTPLPITLNSIGLFLVGFAMYKQINLIPFVFATVVLYTVSIFIVRKNADIINCSVGDKVQMVLANALLPVSIFLFLILFIVFMLAVSQPKRKKRKR